MYVTYATWLQTLIYASLFHDYRTLDRRRYNHVGIRATKLYLRTYPVCISGSPELFWTHIFYTIEFKSSQLFLIMRSETNIRITSFVINCIYKFECTCDDVYIDKMEHRLYVSVDWHISRSLFSKRSRTFEFIHNHQSKQENLPQNNLCTQKEMAFNLTLPWELLSYQLNDGSH